MRSDSSITAYSSRLAGKHLTEDLLLDSWSEQRVWTGHGRDLRRSTPGAKRSMQASEIESDSQGRGKMVCVNGGG